LSPMTDSTAAQISDAPLVDSLRRNRAALAPQRIETIARRAREILSLLVDLGVRRRGHTEKNRSLHPALSVVRRPLEHRFVLPLSALRPGADPLDRSVSGWGQWHPIIRTLDDLLTWATTSVLVADMVANVGRCEHCGQYYISGRRGRHRFCPGTACRDRYWSTRTGAQRSKRARAKQRATLRPMGAQDHIHGARDRQPPPKGASGQKPTNDGPS
jgi:hypothetical protein